MKYRVSFEGSYVVQGFIPWGSLEYRVSFQGVLGHISEGLWSTGSDFKGFKEFRVLFQGFYEYRVSCQGIVEYRI